MVHCSFRRMWGVEQLRLWRERATPSAQDWCEPGLGPATWVCWHLIEDPSQTVVFFLDGLAVWLILAILVRQFTLTLEKRRAKPAVPSDLRARHFWRLLGAVVSLTRESSQAAPALSRESCLAAHGSIETWRLRWEAVLRARSDRKDAARRMEFDLGMVMFRAMSPLVTVAMWLLIAFEVHGFFVLALPWLAFAPSVHLVASWCFRACAVKLYVDYARTTCTDPGRPTSKGCEEAAEMLELGGPEQQGPRWCKVCGITKPPRCHHCRPCGRCVLRMDHHCPFVSNCVGLRNYRVFCHMLLDIVVCSLMIALLLLPQLRTVGRGSDAPLPHRVHVVAVWLVAVLSVLWLGAFLSFHILLITTNRTTLEHLRVQGALRRSGEATGLEWNVTSAGCDNFRDIFFFTPPHWCQRQVEGIVRFLMPGVAIKRSE